MFEYCSRMSLIKSLMTLQSKTKWITYCRCHTSATCISASSSGAEKSPNRLIPFLSPSACSKACMNTISTKPPFRLNIWINKMQSNMKNREIKRAHFAQHIICWHDCVCSQFTKFRNIRRETTTNELSTQSQTKREHVKQNAKWKFSYLTCKRRQKVYHQKFWVLTVPRARATSSLVWWSSMW